MTDMPEEDRVFAINLMADAMENSAKYVGPGMHCISGKKLCMYDARHGYATRKLKAKHGHLEIAATMGHTDGSMLAKVYSHIDEDDEHLRKVLED